MDITIHHYCNYKEATFEIDNTTVETGLLDGREQVELANVFLDAVRELAPELLEAGERE